MAMQLNGSPQTAADAGQDETKASSCSAVQGVPAIAEAGGVGQATVARGVTEAPAACAETVAPGPGGEAERFCDSASKNAAAQEASPRAIDAFAATDHGASQAQAPEAPQASARVGPGKGNVNDAGRGDGGAAGEVKTTTMDTSSLSKGTSDTSYRPQDKPGQEGGVPASGLAGSMSAEVDVTDPEPQEGMVGTVTGAGIRPEVAASVAAGVGGEAIGVSQAERSNSEPPASTGADLLDQLLSHTKSLSLPRNSHMRVQLKPAELGALDLRLAMRDGVLTLQIIAESARTRGLIETALPQLRQTLQARDIQVGNLSMGMGMDFGGAGGWLGSPNPSFHMGGQWSTGWRRSGSDPYPLGDGIRTAESEAAPLDKLMGSHMVDYRV